MALPCQHSNFFARSIVYSRSRSEPRVFTAAWSRHPGRSAINAVFPSGQWINGHQIAQAAAVKNEPPELGAMGTGRFIVTKQLNTLANYDRP